MCGISGVFSAGGSISAEIRENVRVASSRLSHRGPDENGLINLSNFSAAHNRLSIIDLASGQQPMTDSLTGNVIVFNGEIYNYIELRQTLKTKGYDFSTESDTEVLLKAYDYFGMNLLQQLNGMFAFAILDARADSLFIARDRFGEKPLYYFENRERLYFASELSALGAFPECGRNLDGCGVLEYFALGYVSGPRSILRGVKQLMPGSWLRADRSGVTNGRYYKRAIDSGHSLISDDEIETSLDSAIKLRLRADVPVATLLSGGLDSSLITLIASRQTSRPLHSFSFGWAGEEDELPFARTVAELAQTVHHEIKLDRRAFAQDLAQVIGFMDMPQADSASFVVYQLSKCIAENGVKVVLSGDGGDELFGGYDWYGGADSARHLVKSWLRSRETNARDYVLGKSSFGFDVLARAFGESEVGSFVDSRVSGFLECGSGVNGRISFDYETYLPWMLMPKVDRMSMAHAVEVRAPLLDHNLVDRWASVRGDCKVSDGRTKGRVKDFCIARGMLTQSFLERKKMGMNLPLSWWIRTNAPMFRDVVVGQSSHCISLFGKSQVEQWFSEVEREDVSGWSRSSQMIWTAYIFELWKAAGQRTA